MRSILGGGCVLAGLLALSPRAPAADLEPGGAVGYYGATVSAAVDQKPARKLAKEPAYRSKQPFYVNIDLGSGDERFVIGALDESKGPGTGYDTLYLDANNNGDLTDDPKVDAKVFSRPPVIQIQVPAAKVTVKYKDAAPRELAISLFIYRYKAQPDAKELTWMARVMLSQSLQATVDIGGKQVLVAVLDGSRAGPANGCFNDFGVDRLRLDTNGDGKLDPLAEDFPLSRIFAFGGKLWELGLDSAGRGVTVKPSSVPTGEVKLAFGLAEGATVTGGRLTLTGKSGLAMTLDPCAKEPARLPADTYRLSEGALQLADKAGGKWSCNLSGSREIAVAADGAVELKLGAPVKVEPVVAGDLRAGGVAQITHRLVGAAGEAYGVVLPVGKPEIEAPKVSIANSAGGPVTDGKMEFG